MHRLWRRVASWCGAVCRSAAAITDTVHSTDRAQLWGAAETRRQHVRGATCVYQRVSGEGAADGDAGFYLTDWKDCFRLHCYWLHSRLQLRRLPLQFRDVSVTHYSTHRAFIDYLQYRRNGRTIFAFCFYHRLLFYHTEHLPLCTQQTWCSSSSELVCNKQDLQIMHVSWKDVPILHFQILFYSSYIVLQSL